MTEGKLETAVGMCVVALTRYIMELDSLDYEKAYKKLLNTELYRLLKDEDSGLVFETNDYLKEAYKKEIREGKDAFYKYINE
jgi:hypothetical protein